MAISKGVSRIDDLKRFYDLLDQLKRRVGGMRWMAQFGDYRDWPDRGVYFFFEPGEDRSDSGFGPRVVRVGTHALINGSRSTLRQRLAQHRGTAAGGGNHRGSIFRLLVGEALMGNSGLTPCSSWGVGGGEARTAATKLGITRQDLGNAERPIEEAVTAYIGAMPMLWIDVPDEPHPDSIRGTIERNSIALLSNHGRSTHDAASAGWLGRHSNHPLVGSSGLWNQRHTNESHDPDFLDVLEQTIDLISKGAKK